MIKGDNQLTEEKKKLLKRGTKVQFKWHGSNTLYIGRIEIDIWSNRLFFINEHCFENDKLLPIHEGMRYYNPLEDFFFFNEFDILT